MNNVACNLDKKVSDLLSNTTAYKFSFILLLLVDAQFDRDVGTNICKHLNAYL